MEDKFVIEGGSRLCGTVRISGSKNASLPILAASLLTQDKCVISGVPRLADIHNMLRMLTEVGGQVSCQGHQVTVQGRELQNSTQLTQHARKMRASFLLMAPLLVRLGEATLPLPGGCAIGSRPVDLHLKGLAALGAEIEINKGFVTARAERLVGREIQLDFPSVGATENILMAASCAEGTTVLTNAAKEPEVIDLANFLKKMGARIIGEGTAVVQVEGQPALQGVVHTVIPDRIEAGTFLVAAVATGGELHLSRVISGHLQPVINKLRAAGARIEDAGEELLVTAPDRLRPMELSTQPYPGFPTDMQPQFAALMAKARGKSMISETVFENRFHYIEELQRMGAFIEASDRRAIIHGMPELYGARVAATDLRAGAALVIAALQAQGETEINYVYHIDRGYESLEEKLASLGARIRRVSEQAASL